MTTTQGWSSSNHRSFLVFTLFFLLLNCCTNSTISWFFMGLQLHSWIRFKQLALRCFSFLTSKNRFLLHSNYLNFLPTTYHGRKLVIYFETCAVRSFSHLALKSECKQRWLRQNVQNRGGRQKRQAEMMPNYVLFVRRKR